MGDAFDRIGTWPGALTRRSLLGGGLASVVLHGGLGARPWQAGRLRIGVPDDIHAETLAAVASALADATHRRGGRPSSRSRSLVIIPEFHAFPTWGSLVDHATLPRGLDGAVLPWGMLPVLQSAAADPGQWCKALRLDDEAPQRRAVLLLSPNLARRHEGPSSGGTLVIGRPLGLRPADRDLRTLLSHLGQASRDIGFVDLPAHDLMRNTRLNLLDAALLTGASVDQTMSLAGTGSSRSGSAEDDAPHHLVPDAYGIASRDLVPGPTLYLRRRSPGKP